MLIAKCINVHLNVIYTQMQNQITGAIKILNLQRRFASALADTPLKNGCCTLVLVAKYNRINI